MLITKGCEITLNQGHILKVKLTVHTAEIHIQTLTPYYHGHKVYHDFDPESYFQVQGHIAYLAIVLVKIIAFHCKVGFGYFTRVFSMIHGYVMTSQCHIIKVTLAQTSCPGYNFSLRFWMG